METTAGSQGSKRGLIDTPEIANIAITKIEIPQTWKCSNCTFENMNNNLKCNICGFLPLNVMDINNINSNNNNNNNNNNRISITEQSKTWSCDDCTFDNIGENTQCEMCGAYQSQTIEFDTDHLYSRYSRYSRYSSRDDHNNQDPNLSENESIMLPLSPTNNNNNNKYEYIYNHDDDDDNDDDDANDISYNYIDKGIKLNNNNNNNNNKSYYENKNKMIAWNRFKRRLFIKRILLIIAYIFSFVVEIHFMNIFSFWIYFPATLSLMILIMLIIPFFVSINKFLCINHWLLRSITHFIFRCLNIIIAITPLLCIGYKSNQNDIIFYLMSSFILIHFISIFCIDFVVYDEYSFIVSSFKIFLHFIERYNYKLNNDGSWTNPLSNIKCINQSNNNKPIGLCQIIFTLFHISGIIGTYSMALLLIKNVF